MVGDALLDIIFAPEENDGVGMLIGEVNSSLPGNASLAQNGMHKRLMAFLGCLHVACSNPMSKVRQSSKNAAGGSCNAAAHP